MTRNPHEPFGRCRWCGTRNNERAGADGFCRNECRFDYAEAAKSQPAVALVPDPAGDWRVRVTPALEKKAHAAPVGATIRHRSQMYRIIACDGEAHTNGFIDNCLSCAPLWGKLLVRLGRSGK